LHFKIPICIKGTDETRDEMGVRTVTSTILSTRSTIHYVALGFPVYNAELVGVKEKEGRSLLVFDAFVTNYDDINHNLPVTAEIIRLLWLF